jgi:hypothetical protein
MKIHSERFLLKFKFIVIIFNILIVFLLSAAALIPLFVFGFGFSVMFWRSSWPLALILVVALIILNVFFLFNRRLFNLLEREDWPALVDFLEQSVIYKGRYSSREVRLLLNSYLLMSDSAAMSRLEHKVALAKPVLLEVNALIFGVARILEGNPREAADFFRLRLEKGKAGEKLWLRWYYGFSLVLARDFDTAEAEFKALVAISANSRQFLIAALAAYFLSNTLLKYSANSAECRSIAEEGRERVRKALKNAAGWEKEAAKVETEVYAAIIKKYIDEAGGWLFDESPVYRRGSGMNRSEYEYI